MKKSALQIVWSIVLCAIVGHLVLGAGAPSFYSTPGATVANVAANSITPTQAYGTELMVALTAGNWTVGSGWESPIVGPGLIKNADGVGTQTPSAATNIVAATTYRVIITLSAASVGSATYTLGATTGTSTLSAATTYTDYVTTTTTGKLIITPTNTSRFTISAISIKPVSGGIIGSTTNDQAPPGSVGEYFSSAIATANKVSIASSTNVVDMTSLTLTAGDWDVQGNVNFGCTSITDTVLTAGINTVTATIPIDGSEVSSGVRVTTTSEIDSITIPRKRISLSTSGTVYISATATFSAGSVGVYGTLTARRIR